jgi:hypothetical protein
MINNLRERVEERPDSHKIAWMWAGGEDSSPRLPHTRGQALRNAQPGASPHFRGRPSDSGPDKGDRHFAMLSQVPVPISEADRVTLGQTKGTGTSMRSGASPLCLAQSENKVALRDSFMRVDAVRASGLEFISGSRVGLPTLFSPFSTEPLRGSRPL